MSDTDQRKDPTSLLPEEPMNYEFKKKKKKKKRKGQVEDPLKGDMSAEAAAEQPVEQKEQNVCVLDPEVTIKVENIEVELDFNEFANNNELMLEGPMSEESQEPIVKINDQSSHDAVILTFENVLSYKQEPVEEERHTCNICHLVFKTVRTLNLHQRNKHKAYKKSFKYICDDCGLSYEKKNSLIAHTKRKHSPNAPPEDNEERICEVCALVFKGMMRLRMHMQRKHNSFEDSFKFECFDCGLTYDKYRSLIVHRKRKHTKQSKQSKTEWFNCPLCPKIFSNRDTYVRHIQRKHNQEDKKVPPEFLQNLAEATSAGEIPCKECPLVFSSMMYLKLHMRRKHNAYKEDFRLNCTICNLSYDKIESLKRHIRRKHSKGVFCDVCGKQFETHEAYMNHKHEKPIIECSVCGLIFASQGGLQKHLRCTHKLDLGPKTVFCHLCKEGFYENRQLKVHLMKVHLKVTYPCKFCKKVFKTKESYRRHVLRYHSLNYPQTMPDHPCNLCPELFANELELCRHINLAHSKQTTDVKDENAPEIKKEIDENTMEHGIPNIFRCTKCPICCHTWDELRKHYEQCHLILSEAQCQSCGELVLENELPKHMKLAHPVEVNMKCSYCDFETTNKVRLTQHTLRHKNATTLNCEYEGCRYKTYFQNAMDKHTKKHAELGVKLQCSQCPFQTMNKYTLKYHEEVHTTGKKRYVCNQCDYATILPANLVQHKYKHSDVKRFKCEYCNFATRYNTSLRFHVKKKHCDLPFVKE